MPREYMIEYRRRKRMSIDNMSVLCDEPGCETHVSPGLLRLLEEDENAVTHPNLAARVGRAYKLSKHRTLGLMPENRRPGKHYDPDKYKITEDDGGLFRAFKVTRRGKGGVAV